MNERIKLVREYLSNKRGHKVSRQKMADELGISLSNIESYELGRRTPSSAFIKLFCNKYGVNESWLLTGDGDMFAPVTREQEIGQITSSIIKEDNPIKQSLHKIVANLTEEQILLIRDMAKDIVDSIEKSLPD